MSKEYHRPALKPTTMQALNEFRSPGQTPDGAIRELLEKQDITIEVTA